MTVHLGSRFTEALVGAAQLHADQRRKATSTPFISHLLGVASIALEHGANEDQAIAALLHDTIEDAPSALGATWVRQWIGHRFGAEVLAIVEGCTDADAWPREPWLTRKAAYLARLVHEPPAVCLVSAADKLHNTRSVLTEFRSMGEALWPRFNPEAGKAGTVGYYRAVADILATRAPQALASELTRAVEMLEAATGFRGTWPPLTPNP